MTNGRADLTIVVPVGPGDDSWRGLAADLSRLPGPVELFFSATAPIDPEHPDFVLLAGRHSAEWIVGEPGRAGQLNRAAAKASGRFIWFLHSDSRLTDTTAPKLLGALAAAPGALHYSDLRYAPDGPPLMWLNELGASVRSRLFGLPFGDQGFCISRRLFEAVGGFPAGAGEDHRFVWRTRRNGILARPTGGTIVTSARRYHEAGWLATTARHLGLTGKQIAGELLRASGASDYRSSGSGGVQQL